MKYIKLISLSLSTSVIWGLFFIDAYKIGVIGYVLALLFSFYSSYFLKQSIGKNPWRRWDVLLLILFPLLYLLIYLVSLNNWSIYTLFNPLLSGLIVLVLGLRLNSLKKQQALQFFTISYILVYSLSLVLYHKESNNGNIEKYDFSTETNDSATSITPIDSQINISQLKFRSANDVISAVVNNRKPVVLETWHEKCPPCLSAINDTQDFFAEISDSLDHYYVYNPKGNFDSKKVFSFDKIKDISKILIWQDANDKLDLTINADPSFLYFDKEGNLIDVRVGYTNSKQEEFKNDILQFVSENS